MYTHTHITCDHVDTRVYNDLLCSLGLHAKIKHDNDVEAVPRINTRLYAGNALL